MSLVDLGMDDQVKLIPGHYLLDGKALAIPVGVTLVVCFTSSNFIHLRRAVGPNAEYFVSRLDLLPTNFRKESP
jgi:hypothetical protein